MYISGEEPAGDVVVGEGWGEAEEQESPSRLFPTKAKHFK